MRPIFNLGEMTMTRKTTHVVPDKDGGWNIKQGGATRSSGHYDTQQQAIDRAREISNNQDTELYIHRRNGAIREKDSSGNDPFPPRG
jgi:uncharacterized protein YdaT